MCKLWTLSRWIYGLVIGIIGLAGIPGDLKVWKEEWIPILDFLDIFAVRMVLFFSGIAYDHLPTVDTGY